MSQHASLGDAPRLALAFGAELHPSVQARISYVARVFAAVYGYRVVPEDQADLVLAYGDVADLQPAPVVHVPALYELRPLAQPCPAPAHVDGLPSFHRAEGRVDHLGDAFEWLGAQHELASPVPDPVGRVPSTDTLAISHGLDVSIPWASRSFAALNDRLRATAGPRWPGAPIASGSRPAIVLSHDVDVLPRGRLRDAGRLTANVGVAAVRRRDAALVGSIAVGTGRRLAARTSVVSGMHDLLAVEEAAGVTSTYTFVARSSHRQDPGYRLDDPAVSAMIRRVADAGHEVGLHGSYTSLDQPGTLAEEYERLRRTGAVVTGGRQHWLRYRGAELFRSLVRAGATWDSTAGYPDRLGFRHGAAFPFPPYDFDAEAPFELLEIPLVLMEQALYAGDREPSSWPGAWATLHRRIAESGWGGVSVLWHDHALTGTALPSALGTLYERDILPGVSAVTAAELVADVVPRYAASGLALAGT